MNTLFDLFPKARAEIFRLLFEPRDLEIHLRDLARQACLSPAALQKELTYLAAKEFVLTRRDGNRLYYRANTSHPLYPELRSISLKTSGIAATLSSALADIPGIQTALIFGSVAAGTATCQSDVDGLLIGSAGLRKITPILRVLADSLGRELNPVCFSPAEWRGKIERRDAFATRVSAEPKIWLKGGPDALAAMES